MSDAALMQVADALIHDKEAGAGAAAMSPAVSMGGNSIASQGSGFQEAGQDLPWPTVHRTGKQSRPLFPLQVCWPK